MTKEQIDNMSADRIWSWIVCLYFVTIKGVD